MMMPTIRAMTGASRLNCFARLQAERIWTKMAITYRSVKPPRNLGTFFPMIPMTTEKMIANTT